MTHPRLAATRPRPQRRSATAALLEPAPPTPLPQTLGRWSLGALLLFTGVAHMTFARREFVAQVPRSLPFSTDFVVVASGIAELGLGTALIALPRRRIPVGLVAAAFFVAIFPGNIAQYLNRASAFGLDTDAKRFARLFFQPVFVGWALWATGTWAWLRSIREPVAATPGQ